MKRVSVPFTLQAAMILAACTLLVALGLVGKSAYGEAESESNNTTDSNSLIAVSLNGLTPITTTSKSVVYNIESGSCVCNDPNAEYTIVGGSTGGSTVTIKGGSEQNPIRVTLDSMTIDHGAVKPSNAPITVESGYAIIKLRGTNVLKAGYKRVSLAHDWGFAGLCVQKGATCVITSADGDGSTSGSLEAHGGHNKYGGAGIGTNYDDDTGSIYINGGTIKAYGAPSAAGIGSGRDGECYTVCIQGGDVWAWGGKYAAGIGGGDAVGLSTGGSTHDLWIHGGTLHAYGGDNGGAGIGGSEGGGVDKITITGGSITALGCGENASSGSAAGIGSGDGAECSTIKIDQDSTTDLTINAKGYGEGAGIGGANCKSGSINIKLSGGTITATGGPEAAGIGSGDDESRDITIKGYGTINAYAGWNSSAIGAGDQGHSGPINISGNNSRLTINAHAPGPQNPGENFVSYAAIIGSGDGSASDITINNANINLNGPGSSTIEGAGIGTGSSNDLSLSDGGISNIAISNSQIRFYGIHKMDGAGIGAGYGSNIKTIALDNVDYDGPTIGSSCSDRFGTNENSMKSISISNSNIKAIARGDHKRNHAGIGTGPYGTIDSIVISNSNIEAKGVYGGAGIGSGGILVNPHQVLHLASSDGKCGAVTITGRGFVKATGSDGGAGIGGGALTSVYGDISISKGVTVNALGGSDSGAGIGGGKLCSCANITIDGATVTATGGKAAPGIGSGGVTDASVVGGAIQTTWNTVCGNITITGTSNVTAAGGDGAAGIGLGQGAQMESRSGITISGGTVNAQGGARGAGIGAGRESGLGRGAEACRITIEGETKVEATGGVGAAGIGGGYEGGLEQCHINLSENDPNRAYVIAYGGVGAAGIGAGASSRYSTSKGTIDGAHDAKSLSFGGGFVAAYGGNSSESFEEGKTGPGAGIGGGSYQGDLEGCAISGGVIIAKAGVNESGGPSGSVAAEDIGHGGSRGANKVGGDGSDSIYIYGGTVIGKINENERVLVVGGSVKHQFGFETATKSNFSLDPVYQNEISIDTTNLVPFEFAEQKLYSLGLESTSSDYFHCNDVFAIESGENRAKAFLYLPASEQDKTFAFIRPADVTLNYYGTTTANQYPSYASNTNVMKMGAPIAITPKKRSADLVEGQPYIVRVGDLSGSLSERDTACYTSAKNASYQGYRMTDDTMNRDVSQVPIYTNYAATGKTYTDVTVIPEAAGKTMRLTAKLNGASQATDLYWGDGEAVFEKVIQTAPPYVEITNADALTKVYDGTPATNAEFKTNGTITKIRCLGQWGTSYDMTVTSKDDAYMPTEIGNYEVTVWAQLNGDTVTDSATFKIIDPAEVNKLTVKIVDDPTKYYDGKPVVDPNVKVELDGTDVTDQATVMYLYTPGSSKPTEPGVYLVTATATHDDVSVMDTRLFLIRKCPVTLTVEASNKVVDGQPTDVTTRVTTNNGEQPDQTQTVELSYYKKLDDGTYSSQLDSPPVDVGDYRVEATTPGSSHYHSAEASTTFSILDKKVPFLLVDMPERFVYNAQAVSDPLITSYSDGKPVVTYFAKDGSPLQSAPKNVGNYSVEVTVPETENYHAVSSSKLSFTILPRPVMLSISAIGNQSTESAKVVVTMAGALSDIVGKTLNIGVVYDESDTVRAQSMNETSLTTQAATTVQAPIESAGQSVTATHNFAHVGAGQYEVTASFTEDSNYVVKETTAHFDKRMRGYRIAAEDKTVVFGASSFAIQVEVQDTNGSKVSNPDLSYSQVSNEDLPIVSEDAAVIGNNGIITVQNAGVSAVRVDVAGNDTHEGNYDYALITVEKAPLSLTVAAQDKVADGKPANVTWSVDDAAYPTPYSGDVKLTYFRDNAGVRTQLDAAPSESGSYLVVAAAAGDRNYKATTTEAHFKIQDTTDPVNPDNPDNPDKPDTKPTPSNNSDDKISDTNAPQTGDNTVIWPLIVLAALGLSTLVFSTCRVRKNMQHNDKG